MQLFFRAALQPYVVRKFSISWEEIRIFSWTGRKTEIWLRSNIFPSTILKHRLLEGSTILFLHSYTSRTALASSGLGEIKYICNLSRTERKTKSNSFESRNLNENLSSLRSVPRQGHISVECKHVWSTTDIPRRHFFRRSYTSQTLLESPRFVELKGSTSVKDGLVER